MSGVVTIDAASILYARIPRDELRGISVRVEVEEYSRTITGSTRTSGNRVKFTVMLSNAPSTLDWVMSTEDVVEVEGRDVSAAYGILVDLKMDVDVDVHWSCEDNTRRWIRVEGKR